MIAIAVHGGAGRWPMAERRAALDGVRRAVEIGRRILQGRGSALDAVIAAVVVLEDDPLFNAGTGSVLNIEGEAEMDAGVMIGEALRTGNVAAIRRVKNPILIAKKVMDETEHVILSGAGAVGFARAMGFGDFDPVTSKRREAFEEQRRILLAKRDKASVRLRDLMAELSRGTVGAVALDARGRFAAATSTGGTTLKLPGRIGDTPIPGAGNYATTNAAASATGHGEWTLRHLATKSVCDLIAAGKTAQAAVNRVAQDIASAGGRGIGLIAVDGKGRVGVAHGTPFLPHAVFREDQKEIVARMRASGKRKR